MSSKLDIPSNQEPIPLCVPALQGNEWQYIKECLDTGWVSSVGSFVDRFEHEVAAYVGTQYGVATASGTAALHIALLVAGVQPDDEVLVSTLTFIAPANAIRYTGAWPLFIDSDPEYWQMDPQKIIDFVERRCHWRRGQLHNKVTGRPIRAILPVHILGHPVDMDPILAVARKYSLAVIEDATESLGARYKNKMVGTLGDIACFSFNGNKIITTGGGGMIVTDNEAWATKAKYLTTQAKDDPVEYIHHEVGYNYRLNNVQAAMGVAQLEKLDEYIATKQKIAAIYTKELAEIPGITVMPQADWAESIFWMYTILINDIEYGIDRRSLLQRLIEVKIQTRPLWQPLHRSSAFKYNRPVVNCDVAEYLNHTALSLPCSVELSREQLNRVVQMIKQNRKKG